MAEATVHDILKTLKKLTPEQKQWLQETLATTPPRTRSEETDHVHHDEDEHHSKDDEHDD